MVETFLIFMYHSQNQCKMADKKYFTQEGYDRLKNELAYLKNKERPKIAQQIAEAREKGDLSENAEYDAAKEAQGMLELKINQLEDTMSKARVLDEKSLDTSTVQILNTVKVLNKKTKKEQKLTIVSENEADLKKGKISVTSPIGKGLLGKKVGDVVNIEVPNGTIEMEVREITIEL